MKLFQPSAIEIQKNPPVLDKVDLSISIDDETYRQQLSHWQKRLLIVQQAYYLQGKKALIVFEGWDASGKGGAIRRVTEKLDPRGFRVYPISAPTKEEQSFHYLTRFHEKIPCKGALSLLDRSYYGRVLVERLEKLIPEKRWQAAYQEINEFERTLMDDDTRIIKIFIHIDQDEQLARFQARLFNPNKRWKLTEEDLRNRKIWKKYHQAIDDMFAQTSTEHAPWHVISGNNKYFSRVEILKVITLTLENNVNVSPPEINDVFLNNALKQFAKESSQ